MNTEDRRLIEEMREEIEEVSRKLDRVMAHLGIGQGQYSITINTPPPLAPPSDWGDGDPVFPSPYEFPVTTTGGQP